MIKSVLFILLFTLGCFTNQKPKVIVGIDSETIKWKSEIEQYLLRNYKEFEKPFYFSSNALELMDTYVIIINGAKRDTLYDIVMTFNNGILTDSSINPNSTFYRKGNLKIKEYILGWVYLEYNQNKTCINTHIENIKQYKVDTLNFKFKKKLGVVLSKDSTQVCNNPSSNQQN